MKVLFLENVAKKGRKYEVKDVADGFGRNFLIPRKLAELATEKSIARVEKLRSKQDSERKVQEDLLMKNLGDLKEVNITMTEKANEKGHLFAGIHKEELIPVIKEQTHLDVDADHIILDHPIKEIGEHEIEIVVGDKKATFKLIVESSDEK